MSEMTLRSNQIINMTETSRTREDDDHFHDDDEQHGEADALGEERIGHQLTVSTRTSTAMEEESMRTEALGSSMGVALNWRSATPVGTAASATAATTSSPRGDRTRTSPPGSTPSFSISWARRWSCWGLASARQRIGGLDERPEVVQPAPHDEAPRVPVDRRWRLGRPAGGVEAQQRRRSGAVAGGAGLGGAGIGDAAIGGAGTGVAGIVRRLPALLVLERVGLDTSGHRRSGRERRPLLLDRLDTRGRDRIQLPRPLA